MRKVPRRRACLLLIALSALGAGAPEGESSSRRAGPNAAEPAPAAAVLRLVILSDFDNPPFSSWKAGAPEPEGLEPDIVREIAALLGRPLRWDRRPFGDLLPTL